MTVLLPPGNNVRDTYSIYHESSCFSPLVTTYLRDYLLEVISNYSLVQASVDEAAVSSASDNDVCFCLDYLPEALRRHPNTKKEKPFVFSVLVCPDVSRCVIFCIMTFWCMSTS